MITVYVVAEGQTEQNFANGYLAGQLYPAGVSLEALLVGKNGGLLHIAPLVRDLRELIHTHRKRADVFFTTMVDLYKYPKDAPGWDAASRRLGGVARAAVLEEALAEEIGHTRFIPHLQVHEFEALLFANPACFDLHFPDRTDALARLAAVATQFPTPEDINDSEQTAPSKRIIAELPDYGKRKPTAGPDTAELIGLHTLRAKCPHFDAWVTRLEQFAVPPAAV